MLKVLETFFCKNVHFIFHAVGHFLGEDEISVIVLLLQHFADRSVGRLLFCFLSGISGALLFWTEVERL